jgi:hypothetical protein
MLTVSVFRANPAESLALHDGCHGLCGLPFQSTLRFWKPNAYCADSGNSSLSRSARLPLDLNLPTLVCIDGLRSGFLMNVVHFVFVDSLGVAGFPAMRACLNLALF